MSLSRPVLRNPTTRFMQWGGGAEAITEKDEAGNKTTSYEGGKVSYWDKEANDGDGENILVDLPLAFIVLDQLATITGFSKALNSGYWSNEVKDLSKQELVMRSKNGVVARGLYKNIKDEVKAAGGKYTASVYIAFYNDERELVLGHIKFAGGALNEWIEFQKRVDVSKAAVTLAVNPEVKKNGTTYYFVPQFDSMKISAATLENAKKVDAELQNYLDVYFTRTPDEEEPIADEDDDATDIHNIEGVDKPAPKKEVEIENLDDGAEVTEDETPPAKPAKPASPKAKKDENINLHDVEF